MKQLYQFADNSYSRSDVLTDHPTVVIEMTKVRFEVVPAYIENSIWNGDELKIPAPRNKELKWIKTEPQRLKEKLEEKNSEENQFITPLIKLHAIACNYYRGTLKDYFFKFIESLRTGDADEEQKKFIAELQLRRNNLMTLQKGNMSNYAILELQKFLPLIV